MERMAIGAAEISFKMLVSMLKFDSIKLNSGEPIKVMLKATLSLKNLVQHLWKSGLNKEVDGFIDKSVNKEVDGFIDKSVPSISLPEPAILFSPRPVSELDAAAVKLQKFYKSYRTRRNLADCAVVVEELWWKALHFAALEQSSVSSFNVEKHETAGSRWARARTRAAKVGKGLSKDEKAQKLALRHWLEAIDPRHRYGHNLHLYYDIWFQSESTQPFFYWLDVGDGKEVSLDSCSRIRLQRQCIKYLGPKEREAYEVIVENGKLLYRQTGLFIETTEASKWIFVLSTSRNLYVGQKKKGVFHHSSFLSGGAIIAAGRLVAHDGVLEAIWPYSAQYQTVENFEEIISFLQEHNVDLTNVKVDWDLCEGRTAGSSQPSNSPSTRIEINTTGQETSQSASSSRWPIGLLDGGNVVQPDPLEQSTENVAHAAKADLCPPTVSPPNNKMARKSFKTNWRTMSLVFEDHQQHFGRKCEGTAKSLGVTRISMKHGINRASTVNHILKPHGLHWWLFRQKWARRKGYSLGGERTFDVSCLSVDDIFDSRLLFIHRPQFARSSPQILALPDGGKIVGPIALSSSELDATNNRAHHVRRDQSGSTTSHHEWKNTRERSDRQGIAMSLCSVKDLQKHFVCKHKDVVKRLGVNIPMFKSTCRQHRIYWQRCRIKNKANCICKQHGISLVPIVKCICRQHGFHRSPFRQGNSLGGERPAEVISLSTEEKLVSRLQFLHMPLLGRSSLRPLALPSGSECAEHIAFSSREFIATNSKAHPGRQDQCGSSASRLEKERTREMLYREGIASHVFRFEYHQQHFGSTRKNDAKILGVCLSTFKRITRHHGIRRWPNRIRNNVWRSPGPHQEKNLSPTFKTLSTNGQITMENDMGCQNLEQNELLPDSFEDLNFWNRANSSRAEIEKTPTFHDSFSGNCCDADICFSSEYDKTEAAGGSFKWAFQLEGLTTQFTANRNLNTLFCPQPQIASTEVLSEDMGSSEDWRKLLASQAEGFLKGYVSESSNLTFPACSDASAPSQLVTTVLHTMHAIPPMIPPLTGGSSERFPFEGQSMQYPTYPNHNALQLPQPQMALTQILNEDMGSSEDWIGSQQEPFPEGHVSGSIYSKVLTCAGPSLSQLPLLTTPDTMRRIPHMMPPLTSSQDIGMPS